MDWLLCKFSPPVVAALISSIFNLISVWGVYYIGKRFIDKEIEGIKRINSIDIEKEKQGSKKQKLL